MVLIERVGFSSDEEKNEVFSGVIGVSEKILEQEWGWDTYGISNQEEIEIPKDFWDHPQAKYVLDTFRQAYSGVMLYQQGLANDEYKHLMNKAELSWVMWMFREGYNQINSEYVYGKLREFWELKPDAYEEYVKTNGDPVVLLEPLTDMFWPKKRKKM